MDNFFLTTHDAVDYMLAELEDHGLIKPHLPSTATSPSPSEDEPIDPAASDSDEARKKTPKSGVLARYAVGVGVVAVAGGCKGGGGTSQRCCVIDGCRWWRGASLPSDHACRPCQPWSSVVVDAVPLSSAVVVGAVRGRS